jgi:hypothetical protein
VISPPTCKTSAKQLALLFEIEDVYEFGCQSYQYRLHRKLLGTNACGRHMDIIIAIVLFVRYTTDVLGFSMACNTDERELRTWRTKVKRQLRAASFKRMIRQNIEEERTLFMHKMTSDQSSTQSSIAKSSTASSKASDAADDLLDNDVITRQERPARDSPDEVNRATNDRANHELDSRAATAHAFLRSVNDSPAPISYQLGYSSALCSAIRSSGMERSTRGLHFVVAMRLGSLLQDRSTP